MARHKRCLVKRRRNKEGRRRKREENQEKIGDQIAKKVRVHLFPMRSRHFLAIRNTLFRIKPIISTFVFMQCIIDGQIW